MPPQNIRRGFDADDAVSFSGPALAILRAARQDVRWLLDRGYRLEPAIELAGNHCQLTARQRNALKRCVVSAEQCALRAATRLPMAAIRGATLHIDGFNLIITLETALSGSLLLRGDDGVLRDLAGLRGSYRLISQTTAALDLIGASLREWGAAGACFYLDTPVANSGRLRGLIDERSADWGMSVAACLCRQVDATLSRQSGVVSGDARILSRCENWFNLAAVIVAQRVPNAWIVSLSEDLSENCEIIT